jgi:hypothetical protein
MATGAGMSNLMLHPRRISMFGTHPAAAGTITHPACNQNAKSESAISRVCPAGSSASVRGGGWFGRDLDMNAASVATW